MAVEPLTAVPANACRSLCDDTLEGVLKGATPAGVKFKYPVGAYMGAVTALKSNALKGVAAEIAPASRGT